MAHHIFRRCLFGEVVPPVPPLTPFDDRCAIASLFVFRVDGVEIGTSVTGMDVMSGFRIVPIPPGVDSGESPDRVWVSDRYYRPSISFPGLDMWGGANPGGIQ